MHIEARFRHRKDAKKKLYFWNMSIGLLEGVLMCNACFGARQLRGNQRGET
jgi:hypothetical protein